MNKETTALIIPPSPFLANERVFPSLGILKVASVLEESGHPVDVLDLSGIKNFEDVVVKYLEKSDVKNVGITATTPQFPQAVKLGEIIRDYKRRSILGGSHATMVSSSREKGDRGAKAFEQMTKAFDTVVAGDGEIAIFEAIKDNAPEVIEANHKDSIFFLQKGTLDQYPPPARHLIDLESYRYKIDGKKAQSIISQLGCPFECGFCGGRSDHSFRIARSRQTESVIDEIDIMVGKYGYEGIMFYDDELNINNDNLMDLLEGLVEYQEKSGRRLSFRGFVRADLFTAEQAEMMYKAGFRVILSGVESGSDEILEAMHKKTTCETNSRWIEICRRANLKSKALMSIGHPGETTETVLDSLKWVLSNKPDDVDWTIITQYPGSPYFDESTRHPKEKGAWVYVEPNSGKVLYSKDIDYARNANYYKGIPGDYTSFVWTDNLDPKTLVDLRDHCEVTSRRILRLPPIEIVQSELETSMGQGLTKSILHSTKRKDKIK